MYLVGAYLGFLISNKLTKKIVRNWQELNWKLSKFTKQNTFDRWAFVVWLNWKLTQMLTIYESSLLTMEIGLWLLNILYWRGKKKKRREEEEGEKQERYRERESSNERNGLCWHSNRGEREREWLFLLF